MRESFCERTGATKPQFPYHDGLELLPHKLPEPDDEADPTLDEAGVVERYTLHPLARCALHSPAPGQATAGCKAVRLRIVAPLRAGDGRSAQLFLAEAVGDDDTMTPDISHATGAQKTDASAPAAAGAVGPPGDGAWHAQFQPPRPGELIVAKIYDLLYYDHEQDNVDPFSTTDMAYAAEAAVYEVLARLHGTMVPRYYGSYTFELFEPAVAATRAVHLILVEYVRGRVLSDLNPRDFSQHTRQDIVGGIIDAETTLFAEGVWQRTSCRTTYCFSIRWVTHRRHRQHYYHNYGTRQRHPCRLA